jgi:hypothetical protein
VTESLPSVTYGSEASSTFTVDVNPTNGEKLLAAENVTVNVGSVTCVASVGVTNTGTCTIGSYALPASTTPYVVTTMYTGDADIAASVTYTLAAGLTVTKFTPTITVANTTNTSTGNLSLTATVLGTGTVAPTGTVTWAVTVSGAPTTCSTTSLTPGTGSLTATCTITGHAVATYLATASYVPGSDPDYVAGPTSHTLGMYVGGSSAATLTTTANWNFLVNASSAGSTLFNSGDQLTITSPITVTGLTGVITLGFTGTTPTATFTLGTGLGTFTTTGFTCSVTPTSTIAATTCTSSGSVPIAATSVAPAYIDLQAQRLVSTDSFNGYWIVTFTQ